MNRPSLHHHGRHLWQVTFDCSFVSSSWSERYCIPHLGNVGHVSTATADIQSVENEIRKGLGCQYDLDAITTAIYLGRLINE